MSLLQQTVAANHAELGQRIHAAILRHAVFLLTKQSPSPAEVTWRTAVLGAQFSDPQFLARNRAYCCAKVSVYDAATLDAAGVTDVALLAIVPELPDAIT